MGSMNASAQEQKQDAGLQKEYKEFVATLPASMQEQIKNSPEIRNISWKMFMEGSKKDASEGQNSVKENDKDSSVKISVKDNADFQKLRAQVLSTRYLTDDNQYCVGGYINEKGDLVGGCIDSDKDFARQQADAELKTIYAKSLRGMSISAEELAVFDLKLENGNLSRNVRDENGQIISPTKTSNKAHQATPTPKKDLGR